MFRNDPDNLSYGFPKLEEASASFENIRLPKTITINLTPEEIYASIAENRTKVLKDDIIMDKLIEQKVIPALKMFKDETAFIKNGTYSHKFDFRNCIVNSDTVKNSIKTINYIAESIGADGITEINLREIIPYDPSKTPCIYNGMPLRTEIRVFYDFDTKKALYSVNYWDYDYCRPHLEDCTDSIIFDAMKDKIEKSYLENADKVKATIENSMKNVKLEGRWSIDVLLDNSGDFWLIDMAAAERSAYWDKLKIKNGKYFDLSLLPPKLYDAVMKQIEQEKDNGPAEPKYVMGNDGKMYQQYTALEIAEYVVYKATE